MKQRIKRAEPAPQTRLSSSDRLTFVLLAIAYTAVLQWCYSSVVAPIWGYAGLKYVAPELYDRVVFSALAVVPALWVPLHLQRPTQWMCLYLYIAVYIPSCFVPLFRVGSPENSPHSVLNLSVVLCICMAVLSIPYGFPLARYGGRKPPEQWFVRLAMIGFLATAYLVLLFSYGNAMHFVLSLDVREQRRLGREVLASMSHPLLIGYLVTFTGYAINPFLIALGLFEKRRVLVVVGIAGQLFLYMTAASRALNAAVAVVIFVFYAARQRRIPFASFCLCFLILFVLIATLLPLITGSPVSWEINSIVVRSFLIPAWATHVYYDYFSEQPQTHFSHIRGLGWLDRNPYGEQPLGFVIGESLGSPEANYNANLWADGYSSDGFAGMLIATIIAAVSFYVADCLLASRDLSVVTAALAAHGLNFADISIFTLLLGYGFVFSVVLLAIVGPEGMRKAGFQVLQHVASEKIAEA